MFTCLTAWVTISKLNWNFMFIKLLATFLLSFLSSCKSNWPTFCIVFFIHFFSVNSSTHFQFKVGVKLTSTHCKYSVLLFGQYFLFYFAIIDAMLFRNNSASFTICQQFAINSFLDKVDDIKVLLHMHSFTYDFHLRALCGYVAERQLWFTQGYHLSSCLSDFIKYYNKGPNFARNLIHSGCVVFHSLCLCHWGRLLKHHQG